MNDILGRKPGTAFPEIFAALAKPFPKGDVKTRPQGGRQLSYITARTAMNRLDEVLGNENWWDDYVPGESSVLCRLTIRIPDGPTITKCDAGGYAGMSDQGDDDKSGFSDAFKRAAVKFGVGRYLYNDGVPNFEAPDAHHAKNFDNGSGHGVGAYAAPETVKAYEGWIAGLCHEIEDLWTLRHTSPTGEIAEGLEPLMPTFKLSGHMFKWARREKGLNAPENCATKEQKDKYAATPWSKHKEDFETEARRYGREEWSEAIDAMRKKAAKAAAKSVARPGRETAPLASETSDVPEDHPDSDVWPEGKE